jgi:hypothetical protein
MKVLWLVKCDMSDLINILGDVTSEVFAVAKVNKILGHCPYVSRLKITGMS